MDDSLTPSTYAEAVALFRHGVLGALTQAKLERGQLRAALVALSQQRFRPPNSKTTRSYSVTTLERWYYAFLTKHLEGLKPAPRSDKGRAQELSPEQRQLLCDIRREYPSASATLMVRTLVADGRLQKGAVSGTAVRRLLAEAGLDRLSQRASDGGHTRLRWEAARPGALWHGDVCHGLALRIDGKSRPLRVHALMDDASPLRGGPRGPPHREGSRHAGPLRPRPASARATGRPLPRQRLHLPRGDAGHRLRAAGHLAAARPAL